MFFKLVNRSKESKHLIVLMLKRHLDETYLLFLEIFLRKIRIDVYFFTW